MPYRCFEELSGTGVPEPPPPEEYEPPEPIYPEEDMGLVERAVRVKATDYLRVNVWTVAVSSIVGSYTVVLDDGTVVRTPFQMQRQGYTYLVTQQFPLMDGWLVDVSVYCGTAYVQHGQMYVGIYMVEAMSEPVHNARCLAAGYATYASPVNFPRSGILPYGTGPGCTLCNPPQDMDPGSEILLYFWYHHLVRIESISFTLITSSAPGDRDIRVNVGEVLNLRVPTKQPPSTSWTYIFGAFPYTERIDTDHYISAPFPYTLELYRPIRTVTESMDVGDVYIGVQATVTMWIAPTD